MVLGLELALHDDGGLSEPVAYAQLASALGVELGARVPARATVRDAVLALRASKGMVWDPADPDSVSAGSFFTNPIVTESFARAPAGRRAPLPDRTRAAGARAAAREPRSPRGRADRASTASSSAPPG